MVDSNAFLSNFMQGFSFVDDINSRKRKERMLDQRLREDREERAFQRKRQGVVDKRQEILFGQQQEDRTSRLEDKEIEEEGNRFAAMGPDASDEDLIRTAPFSAAAMAELRKRYSKEEIEDAIRGAGTIPQAGAAGNQATQSQGAGAPGAQSQGFEAALDRAAGTGNTAPDVPSMTPEERATHDEIFGLNQSEEAVPNMFGFEDSKARKGQETVSEEEFNKFSPGFQEKGFLGKAGDVVGGQIAQTARAFTDVLEAGANIITTPGRAAGHAIKGTDDPTAPQNIGQEFTGEINLPGEWTTKDEFAEISGDPAATQAAAARNVEIAREYEKRGENANAMTITSAGRQGTVLQNSDQARREAFAAEQRAVSDAQEFLDPATQGDTLLGQLAVNNPKGAVALYLERRATLQDVNPGLAIEMDSALVPAFDAVEADLQAEAATTSPNTAAGRRQRASLGNLQETRNIVAKHQPSISKQAGIKSPGLKIGDQTRAQATTDTIWDPDRPKPTQYTNAQVGAAGTVAARISPNKRLNERQIESLAVLAQAGWIDKPTALSVMMTGAWPPGKNPNAIKSMTEFDNNLYGRTEAGDVVLIQRGTPDPSKGPKSPTREITEERLGWVKGGISSQFPNMKPGAVDNLARIVYEDPGFVRSRFNVTSSEDMHLLGIMLADTKILSGKKFDEMEDGPLWFNGNTDDAPTTSELFFHPEMRVRIATALDYDYKPMPELKDFDGIDEEGVRQNLREGRAGPEAAQNADRYTVDEALNVYGRDKLLRLDAAGRIQANSDGSFTILPPPEGE